MPSTITNIACTLLNLAHVGLLLPTSNGQEPVATKATSTTTSLAPAEFTMRVPHTSVALLDSEFEYAVPFEQIILETDSRGDANCRGELKFKVENHDCGVAVCLHISGTVHSDSVGKNGPASITASCVTRYAACKRLTFSKGLFVTHASTIKSDTEITISHVDTDLPGVRGVVVKRVAMRKALGLREEAEQIVNDITNSDICEQFDQKVDGQIDKLNFALRSGSTIPYVVLLTNLVNVRVDSECIGICVNCARNGDSNDCSTTSNESLVRSDESP